MDAGAGADGDGVMPERFLFGEYGERPFPGRSGRKIRLRQQADSRSGRGRGRNAGYHPLGDYDGAAPVKEGDIGTFSEAYALMLDKMIEHYPEADIYCCTIAEVGRWDEAGKGYAYRNAHGAEAKDYNAWIKAVAEAKGVPVIDVYECGITYENIMDYTSEGTHPNAAGAKLIADKVCEGFS